MSCARCSATPRLVTLTGPGGIGKTSLAVETARSVADRFADGAWFVPLAQVDEPSIVPPTHRPHDRPVRRTRSSPAADALGPYLAERSVLLVLDNFERLLDAATIVADILRASPASRILVTSRAPLRIPGEQEYPVAPLVDTCLDAVRGAAHERSNLAGSPGTEQLVLDDVCSLLDGLPLGVELAAARVAHLPVTAIRDRLAARLPLPGAGPRDVPDRQRTLAAAFAWSHDMLPTGSQHVLHDLAVFEGGFDLDQATQVVEPTDDGVDVLDHLVALVDQSLVKRDAEDTVGSGIRFRLLATIRGFALERLDGEGRRWRPGGGTPSRTSRWLNKRRRP